jgi:hypothetical protein
METAWLEPISQPLSEKKHLNRQVSALRPRKHASVVHASYLWRAQGEKGRATDGGVKN